MNIRTGRFCLFFAVLVFFLACQVSCAGGCGGCDYGEDASDDDSDGLPTDDDTGDDDTTDDDTADDDDVTLPDEVTVSPADGEQGVALNASVSITTTAGLDPATFDFSLSGDSETVQGLEQYSNDQNGFYFFPEDLLSENTNHHINFTYQEVSYTTEFTTVQSAGEITISGNSEANPGGFFGFKVTPVEILYPAQFSNLILAALGFMDFLIAPVFVASETKDCGTVSLGGGEAADFDEDGNFELNHGAAAHQFTGQICGDYMSMSGSFEFELRDVLVTVDQFFLSAVIRQDGFGNPMIEEGYVAFTVNDCAALAEAMPGLAGLIETICNEETGLFMFTRLTGYYNPLPDLAFDPAAVTADAIGVSFDPPLYSNWFRINPLNARFEIYQSDALVLTSADFADNIEFPDCCTEVAPDWWSFSNALFNVPAGETLDPGDYTLRYYIGLYGGEEDFTVGDDDDTADDDTADDDTV